MLSCSLNFIFSFVIYKQSASNIQQISGLGLRINRHVHVMYEESKIICEIIIDIKTCFIFSISGAILLCSWFQMHGTKCFNEIDL